MNKKLLLISMLSGLFLYSSVASACAYCYGNHGQRYSNNSNYSKLQRDFEDKRYELNKLYDQGVSETDDNVKSLIKDLDSLSDQIKTQRESARPYGNNRYHDNRSYDNRYHDRCW
ncbi:hypothetical protein [Proteus hauseri]|uniref:hypothetical protein n=1 Tax=Proteus hauseri TaxID=183417 RepID=UPI0032DB4C86